MPTKTPAKKRNVKVTQLDDALPDTPITMKTIYYAVVNIHGRLNRMEFETAAVKALLKSPAPEPKEPEPHRFKEGDWVRSKRHDTMLQIESFSKDGTRFWSNMSDAFGELLECYRPATQAEIDAHLEAEAIKKQKAERRAEEEAKARQLRIQQLKKELAELEANAEP